MTFTYYNTIFMIMLIEKGHHTQKLNQMKIMIQ